MKLVSKRNHVKKITSKNRQLYEDDGDNIETKWEITRNGTQLQISRKYERTNLFAWPHIWLHMSNIALSNKYLLDWEHYVYLTI